MQSVACIAIAKRNSIQKQIIDRCRQNYGFLQECISDTAAEVLQTDGGWYAVIGVPKIRSDEEWVMGLLEKDDVLIHPGYFFDFTDETKLVCSLLPLTDRFKKGVSCLRLLVSA